MKAFCGSELLLKTIVSLRWRFMKTTKLFLELVKHAGLRPEEERCVEKAVVIAFSPIRTESLCEDLELSEDQLSFLRLTMARQIFA